MGAREEETGNVVAGPAIMGEPWWLIKRSDGTEFCCHVAGSWFKAREVGRALTGKENVSARLVEKKKESHMVKILKEEPVISVIAEMGLSSTGINEMAAWVASRRPECMPDEYRAGDPGAWLSLFPHAIRNDRGQMIDSENELLVELAGRKCYDSFGLKAGKKLNAEYIANTQQGDVPHASIMYHAKMTFFIAGVSRRVSHELIRHYVGADRTEEGSPSQESTRYVEHSGCYVAHPAILHDEEEMRLFSAAMAYNYNEYRRYIERRDAAHVAACGAPAKGMDRKRIFESASSYLSHSCETSFIWTTNPIALAKMFKERDNEAADLEYLRFARKWKRICAERWLGLFPQPWMKP
jgi:thymidylate synthase (FAD)